MRPWGCSCSCCSAPAAAVAAPAGATAKDSPQAATERTPALARRIVKKATLEIEVASPSDAQAKATRIVEAQGGYVASSERGASRREDERTQSSATLTLRVPVERFSAVLAELRRLGAGPGSEQVSTQDMTEEFIDLEARIKNQRALEERFLELMKSAAKVDEALRIEREIASVRTEIDRMQGRQRFLEHETELSTITLSIGVSEPLVSVSFGDFRYSVRHAYADALDLGAGIVTTGIRLLGVLVPLGLLLGIPLGVGLRLLRRRRQMHAAV